jgi:hypothetical protein
MTARARPALLHRLAARLGPVVHHPGMSLATGAGMLAAGAAELLSDLVVGFEAAFAAHHGLILFGIVMGLRGAVDLVSGLERLEQGLEEIEAAHPARGDRP